MCVSRSGEVTKTHTVHALSLHVQVSRAGLETHPKLGNFLVQSLAAEAISLHESRQVFEKLSYKSVCSWNSLVNGYARHNYPEDALRVFQKMREFSVDPDRYTLVAILKTCIKLNRIQTGLEIHAHIKDKGIAIDIFLGSILVDMYGRYGFLEEALEVFENLQVRDVVPWTSLITGYAEQGQVEESIRLLERMQIEGICPDAILFLCCLNACSSGGIIEKGREIHAVVVGRGILDNNLNVSNALIDMYAKCGLFEDAKGVFEKLPVRDIVSWNALVAGYTKQGHSHEALACFDQMRLGKVIPDAVTFICAIKSCGSICAIEKGCNIHDEVNKRGLLNEAISIDIGNALIAMYASCRNLRKAEEVFDQLPVKDVISWTTLISGYIIQGCSEKALNCFECLQVEAVCPSTLTYKNVLKACGNSGAIKKGQQIHGDISRKGLLEIEAFLCEALIEMYASCGLFLEANAVVDKLQVQDIASWTALIVGYLKYDRTKEALDCLKEMQVNGASPDIFTFVCSLKACGAVKYVEEGQQLHAEIIKRGYLECDIVVGNALIDMYASFDMLSTAQDVFENLPSQNTISWTILIEAYYDHEHSRRAWNSLQQMQMEGILPDIVTFLCVLKSCTSACAIKKGYKLHAVLSILEEHNIVGSILIDFYANCGLLQEAHKVFDEVSTHNVVSWTSLIKGYTKSGYNEDALSYFEKMQVQSIAPNATTFLCVLKACKGIVAAKGLEIHAEICRKGLFETDPIVGNALIDMYASLGLISNARRVFDTLLERDICSWSALIAAFVDHDCSEEALELFQEMQFEGISPDGIAFSCALKACSCMGAADKGQEIHAEISRKSILEGYVPVGNALVDMYINNGFLKEAQEVLIKLPARDTRSWITLVTGYAKYGQVEQAFKYFEEIQKDPGDALFMTCVDKGEDVSQELSRKRKESNKEKEIGFVSILNACSHAGAVDTGNAYFEALNLGEYGLMPTLEHYMCMIDILSRAGQVDDALRVITLMPFHPNQLIWHTVLSASKKWGIMELGEHAFAHAVQLYADDTSAYVCMHNIYIAAHMQG